MTITLIENKPTEVYNICIPHEVINILYDFGFEQAVLCQSAKEMLPIIEQIILAIHESDWNKDIEKLSKANLYMSLLKRGLSKNIDSKAKVK